MAITRQGGIGIPLNNSPLAGNNNIVQLPAGGIQILAAGQYYITPGPYSCVQTKDPITGLWRTPQTGLGCQDFYTCDGGNVRLVNLAGCAIGATITNVGSGYTSAPTVTASAGGSTWAAVVGGAINSTVTITAGGSGYLYPPILQVSAPPAGGVAATAYCTISAGAINAVTVVNQGAGYTVAPTITVLNDPRDTAGSGAVLTVNATLAGSGTITAIYPTNHGTPVTSVPTLTISGGGGSSGAATAVMAFAATGYTVSNGGAVYGNAQPTLVMAVGGVPATSSTVVNPQLNASILTPRTAFITGTSTAGGAVTATGAVVQDPGLFAAVPNGFVLPSGTGALPTTTAIVTITVGGVTDTSYVQPF